MKRWVIYHQDQRIGQASSWHKALDVLRRQIGVLRISFDCTYLNSGMVMVHIKTENGLAYYSIKQEQI